MNRICDGVSRSKLSRAVPKPKLSSKQAPNIYARQDFDL
ncbi:hypothetical protein NC651_028524 [Populus alba x Populus x berolinensis]|nr:hypothetical protein NC651_028524 [Populus alba x Populus x berolinensis]